MEASGGAPVKSAAEQFFRESDYWQSWSQVPDLTADIAYALEAAQPSDARILDVPSGRGRLLKAIRARAPRAALFGLDVNPSMVAQMRRELPDVHAQVASVYAIPFRDRTFDAVLCHESFMHFDRPREALRELCRVSHDRLYFSVTTRRQLNTLLRRLGLVGVSDVPHWTYNLSEVEALLPEGFRWRIVGAFLLGRKALRLSHRAYLRLHQALGRYVPQPVLRTFGQSLFIYGSRTT